LSEREKYLALADEIDAEQMVFVVNMIQAYLSAEKQRRAAKLDEAIAKAEASGYVGPFATWEEAKAEILADDKDDDDQLDE